MTSARPAAGATRPAWIIAELSAAGLSGTVANVSVTVAVAAIARDLDASIAVTAATVVGLNVAMAFTMPLAGAWSARLGPRTLLIAAGAGLVISSLALSLAPNLLVLAIARAGQGAVLAAVVPVSVQASGQLLEGDAKARALGWWGASNGLGLAFAPLVAGGLSEVVGWRWVAAPSCVLGLALALTAFRAFPAALRSDDRIALRGQGIVAIVTGTAMASLATASAGLWLVAGASAAACAAAIVPARRAARPGGPLAHLDTWLRDPLVRRSSTGATLQMVANGLIQVGVPAWLIVEGHVGAGGAAVLLLGMTLPMASMGPITGRRPAVAFDDRLRRGLVGCGVGLGALGIAASVGPWWVVGPGLLVVGFGAGSLLAPSLTAFSRSRAGTDTVALSLYNLARLGAFGIGGLLGGVTVDAGAPGTAFLTIAAICAGAAFAFRGRSGDDPDHGTTTPAPGTTARGGTDG